MRVKCNVLNCISLYKLLLFKIIRFIMRLLEHILLLCAIHDGKKKHVAN